jgi:hypothetical protein
MVMVMKTAVGHDNGNGHEKIYYQQKISLCEIIVILYSELSFIMTCQVSDVVKTWLVFRYLH